MAGVATEQKRNQAAKERLKEKFDEEYPKTKHQSAKKEQRL